MRILLAHDGSDGAAEAAQLVRAIAWPAGSTLRVISVIERPPATLSTWTGTMPDYSAELDGQITEYYEGELARTADGLQDPNRHVERAVLRGRPATVVIEEAGSFRADLVVVGSRGHGAIASLVLGSVSGEVVDHAPCPVLVARKPTLSRLVFATDGSPSAMSAQALLSEWSIFDGLPIRVVSVADVPQPWHTGIAPTMYRQVVAAYAKDREDAKREHERVATDSVDRLRAAGRDASPDVRDGDAAGEVIAAAEAFGADLIVLGSRGRSGLTRLLLGSVARNVVHGSAASILVVHDNARAAAAGS
ncbi:MAG TPA: universal stress protein [Candidatus Limnocylindrales bacterium]|nr:universal stress protein [Candidatus Limnocylindrales bacterium]